MESIRQGETYDFSVDVSGDDESGFTATMSVLQYPGKTPAITRALTYTDGSFLGTLTSTETLALAVGQWFIHVKIADSDEDLRKPIKIYIAKSWT